MSLNDIMREALQQPSNAVALFFSQKLSERFPNDAIFETQDSSFYLTEFLREGLCTHQYREDVVQQIDYSYLSADHSLTTSGGQVWQDVEWQGERFQVVLLNYELSGYVASHTWIIAASLKSAQAFFLAVCQWNTEVRGEVLVYNEGCWSKSAELFAAIQSATFDNLILPPALKEEIQADFAGFLANRALYDRYRIPWKRGVLLTGPPGNGKTHTVKALINWLQIPCLYVKRFGAQYISEQRSMRDVFQRARDTTPCLLVLEDLDSLITERNRSFFLNELDGFASNTGIIVLATANHPERLDSAIVDRPSRFDRKYHFELPALPERDAYLQSWEANLEPEMRLTDAGRVRIVEATEGFSFAYLKELMLSSLMRWIANPIPHAMDAIMHEQSDVLREQMQSSPTPAPPLELYSEDYD